MIIGADFVMKIDLEVGKVWPRFGIPSTMLVAFGRLRLIRVVRFIVSFIATSATISTTATNKF